VIACDSQVSFDTLCSPLKPLSLGETMSGLSAILIIDMQNDFLTPGGAFTKRHIETSQLTTSITWLVQAARQQKRPIVWVTSQYGEVEGSPESLAGKTHTGSVCCAKGSWGAQLVNDLQPLFDSRTPQEVHIVKNWYSAFEETPLYTWLQLYHIKKLSLCGVASNVCILQTAKAAASLGFEVEILSDITTASTQGKHMIALREAAKVGVKEREWGALLSESGPVKLAHIGAGEAFLWCSSLKQHINDKTFETLHKEVEWSTMHHRGGTVPRLIALQGTKTDEGIEPLYRHPADEQPTLVPWTPTVDLIRRVIEQQVGHPLNHCLLQLYRHGRDWISEHSDKTLDVMRPSVIVNVSLGQMRTMIIRCKDPQEIKSSAPQKLPLPHGSFFCMDLETNQQYYHGIKQLGPEGASRSGSTDEPRISLTMRYIGSFYNPKTGAVWGIGSSAKTRDEGEARAQARLLLSKEERLEQEKKEADALLKLFRDENMEPTFDANNYQPGFDVLNFQSLLEAK
jgi:nicotinamidase-related amidase/alkylated DNA repair dioxygenase AlkB